MKVLHCFVAAILAPTLAVGAISFDPYTANAQADIDEDVATANTAITIVAAPDWGQKTEVIVVEQNKLYVNKAKVDLLSSTGDFAPWVLLVLAGAVMLSMGLLVKAAIKDTSGVSDWFSIENNAVTNHKDRVSLNPGESIAVAWSIENVDQSIIDVAKNTGKVTLATIDFTYSEDKPINSDNKLNNDNNKKQPFAVIFETNDAQGNSVQTAKLYNREQLPVVGQEYDNSGKVLEVITNIENNPGIFSCKQIQSVEVVDDGIQPQTTMSWFQCCYKLASADLSKLDTSKVTNMQSMFNLCSGLTSLDLSSWDASNVTTMQAMFAGCNQLSKLDLPSGWNTSSATFMGQMFSNCASLKTLDCSGWNTSNVTDMNSMFFGCTSLASLKLTGWNTSGVMNMQDMFGNCEALASLDLLNLNTNKVQNAARMFSGCTGLEDITLGSGWNLEPHKCGLGTLYVLNEGKYSEYNGASLRATEAPSSLQSKARARYHVLLQRSFRRLLKMVLMSAMLQFKLPRMM
ncbi:BspA family leucine-rich repeat surface protein [Senegalimassilia anaerobia]|uniref:BspA family leucine-rich repeat surface protein n=1 Tax=Senegalimassilia anaerobia TaxID=1473216 RepID=UPI00265EEC32|nr:BspA family leucine-rich repeat surface protein [Senegalimassilia anaerobia]